ncbi:hypothetical protein [Carnobacterium maltaromaticum]|nr:hypothetical protein [Carnobacterium maltaromaticum]
MSTYKQYTIKNTVYFISIYPEVLSLAKAMGKDLKNEEKNK